VWVERLGLGEQKIAESFRDLLRSCFIYRNIAMYRNRRPESGLLNNLPWATRTLPMKLATVKEHLEAMLDLPFVLDNGQRVPDHFHVTEVGLVTRHFIDCGGTVRKERMVNFQLWVAQDEDHRLKPQKLLNIIGLSEHTLGDLDDLEVEVEYQAETIGRYQLEFDGKVFRLMAKRTDCLAKDNCGISAEKMPAIVQEHGAPGAAGTKPKVSLAALSADSGCCQPGGGCC